MSSIINDNLEVRAPKHIDSRVIVADSAARLAIDAAVRYEGLRVFQLDTYIWWELKGGIDDAQWVQDGSVHFDPNVAYATGDAVFYQGILYLANTPSGPEAWNASNFDQINDLIADSTQAGHAIETEGSEVSYEPILNFLGTGVSVVNNGGKTEVTIAGSALTEGDGIDITANVVSLDLASYSVGGGISMESTSGSFALLSQNLSFQGTTTITGRDDGQASLYINPAGGGETSLQQFRENDGLTPTLSIYSDQAVPAAYLISEGNYDLRLQTDNDLYLQGLLYPNTDGTVGQALVTDGSGNLSFATVTPSGSKHVIEEAGAAQTSRASLNFGPTYWDIQDDPGDDATDVTLINIPGGASTAHTANTLAILHRTDTAANWTSNDPTPAAGELCFESDTGIFKIGDGSTAYSALSTATGNTFANGLSEAAGAVTWEGALTKDTTIGGADLYDLNFNQLDSFNAQTTEGSYVFINDSNGVVLFHDSGATADTRINMTSEIFDIESLLGGGIIQSRFRIDASGVMTMAFGATPTTRFSASDTALTMYSLGYPTADGDEYAAMMTNAAGTLSLAHPVVTNAVVETLADFLTDINTVDVDITGTNNPHVMYTETATNELRIYRLRSGLSSEDDSPYIVTPGDYAASTNEKMWELVSTGGTPTISIITNTTATETLDFSTIGHYDITADEDTALAFTGGLIGVPRTIKLSPGTSTGYDVTMFSDATYAPGTAYTTGDILKHTDGSGAVYYVVVDDDPFTSTDSGDPDADFSTDLAAGNLLIHVLFEANSDSNITTDTDEYDFWYVTVLDTYSLTGGGTAGRYHVRRDTGIIQK